LISSWGHPTGYSLIKEEDDPKVGTKKERKAARKATRDRARFAGSTNGDFNRVVHMNTTTGICTQEKFDYTSSLSPLNEESVYRYC